MVEPEKSMTFYAPVDLLRRVKVYCAEAGITMKEFMRLAIEGRLRDDVRH